jgi:hypothetical protein
MKKFALAAICTVAMVGFAMADEFTALITKVDATGGKVTYKKVTGKTKDDQKIDDKATTTDVAKTLTVVKGKFDMDTKKMVDGDAIEGGLKAETLSAASDDKGVRATIVIADDGADKGKITKIRMFGGKKKN